MQRQIPDADGVNFLQYQKHGHQTKNNKVDGYDNWMYCCKCWNKGYKSPYLPILKKDK